MLAQLGVAQKKAVPQADSIYQQGMKDVQRGDLQGARTAFEQAVKLAPNSAEAHNSLGWVLLSQGHIEDAVAQLKTAVKLQPKLLLARINLANALVRISPPPRPRPARRSGSKPQVRKPTARWARS